MMREVSPARRAFKRFLLAVAGLHVVAIALFYGLGVATASATAQRRFAWAWMGATVAVVFVGLRTLKRARKARD